MNKWDESYYRFYFSFLNEIDELYGASYDEIAHAVYSAGLSTDKRFTFRGNKRLSETTDGVLKRLAEATTAAIAVGTSYTWSLSNDKNDEITRAFLHDRAIPERFMYYNADRLAALQKRKIDGLTVSSRVWKYTESLKTDLEMAIDVALREGTSAAELSRSIRRNLNNPDALFRRVRNQYGQLVPSKAMLAYHPGAGVYRSAAQNAIRLAGTEVNMAYREADLLRWGQMDFVVGYEVKTSLRKLTVCPLCDELQGVYPKSFVWTGWHPRCRCYATPVLAKEGEFIDWLNNGGSANFSGQITDTPPQFKQWVNNNTDNIMRAEGRGKLPYFLRDNGYEWYLANTPQQLKIGEIRRLVAGGRDSYSRFVNVNGTFTAERKALHDKIVADYMRNGSTKTNTAYMLGGAPANGKSTLVDSGILPHPKGILKIDPDAIKAQIPEYNRMLNSGDALLRKKAAGFVHEESSHLSKLIQSETNRQKFDFVLDGVNDGAFDKLAGKIAQIKSTGRRVRADYVSLDADLSVKLMVQRAEKTGRYVDRKFVTEMNSEVSKLVPQIIKNKTIDELYLWDTNINGNPRLILTQIDGRLKIYDRGLYDDFLRKATN